MRVERISSMIPHQCKCQEAGATLFYMGCLFSADLHHQFPTLYSDIMKHKLYLAPIIRGHE